MDEHRDPQRSAPDEGELLAAYLDADTDEVTSARVERMLTQDQDAAARLDALARTRVRLQRLDEVAPPEGFRERLNASLDAERAHAQRTPPRDEEPQAQPTVRRTQRWFAPLAAAATLILVAVVGGSTLLRQSSGGEEAAAPAELQAGSSRAADAPMAGADDGAEAAEEDAGPPADESAQAPGAGRPATAGESLRSAAPGVPDDPAIAERLRRPAQIADDPVGRESELRDRAGLAAGPHCLAGVDATAVDLVEINGQVVIAALIDARDGQEVVLFEAQSCDRLRRFPAG